MCINLVDILVSKVGSKFNLVNVPILGHLLYSGSGVILHRFFLHIYRRGSVRVGVVYSSAGEGEERRGQGRGARRLPEVDGGGEGPGLGRLVLAANRGR